MAAIANLVVADATPTNHTLYPLSASIASSKFMARESVTIEGNRMLEIKGNLANSRRRTDRITVLYSLPKEVVKDGVTVVESTARFIGEFVMPVNWSDTERNHFATEVASLAGLTPVKATVKRDFPY